MAEQRSSDYGYQEAEWTVTQGAREGHVPKDMLPSQPSPSSIPLPAVPLDFESRKRLSPS